MIKVSKSQPDQHIRSSVVALGGTGVVGSALRQIAIGRGLSVVSVSLDKDAIESNWRNLFCDLSKARDGAIRDLLERALPTGTPIYAVCNIAGLAATCVAEVADFAAARGVPVVQISSCLLYRSSGPGLIDESTPVLRSEEAQFPYLRLKLEEESALMSRDDVDWRILRTQHVLGKGGLLGCLPNHNRDPQLLETLRKGLPLHLAKCGNVRVSFVHAADLARALLDLSTSAEISRQAVNVVHPEPVLASEYFRQIADILGVTPPDIRPMISEPEGFWALTARDNHFFSRYPSVQKLTFFHTLRSALTDTLSIGEAPYTELGRHMYGRLGLAK